MKPRYILGEKREHLLKHIDDTIMSTRKKSRILIGAGLGFLLLHNMCINRIREHNRNVLQ